MERHYRGCLCYRPPIEDGYYYDMFLEGRQVSSTDFDQLDTLFRGWHCQRETAFCAAGDEQGGAAGDV